MNEASGEAEAVELAHKGLRKKKKGRNQVIVTVITHKSHRSQPLRNRLTS
jgi:hypothetical protein